MRLTRHATINGREYRVITTTYGGTITHTVVQVLVVFAEDNGTQWRALSWRAEKRVQEVLNEAR